MWTGIRTVAEVNKWEGELEVAETEVNIQEWGLGLVHYTLFGQPLRFSSVLLLFLLYWIVPLLVSARKPIQYSLNKALHTKEVQLSQEWFVTTTWPPFHACDTNMADVISCEMLDIRAIFVWPWNENARTKQKQQTKGNSLIDWFIERIQTRVAFGWLSECSGEKTSCLRTF